ncbi:sigma 54-interacting transcriptional regulator [Clostridium sp.]|uniref:sigma 54-interacting transcriptional regulator n=1 Tax=Clostridium sp. TaxID=1506 RepID=UPI002FCA13F1
MSKIAIIVPKDLMDTARIAAKNYDDRIIILEGSMGNGVIAARKAEQEDYDAIIARGGTQLLIKATGINIPTIAVPITPLDIFEAISEAEKINKNMAFIAFNNMLLASESYAKIAGRTVKMYQVKDEKEVEEKIIEIAKTGINVVVGGGIVAKYAPLHGIKFVVIKSGKDSFITAIEEAKKIIIELRKEKEAGERVKAIIQNSHDGIICVDKDGTINIFNHSAEKLFNLYGKNILGKNIEDVLPEVELNDTLMSGVEETEIIKKIKGIKLIISKIPIQIKNETINAVAILKDADDIHKMDEKIRQEIAATGHYANYTFEDVIGCSVNSKETVRIGKEYSKVNSTILIEGETGTGKEIMAQAIHNYSRRSNKPFVAVNCAALPESLLESELFGYASGAFTGADKRGKRGLFELAHGGTIFLDEISEMNPLLQGRLLRVLQEKQVMRIGDNKVIPIDVRVIAATNKNLYKLIREGNFREDLFYRLNVLKILLLPLRERREDISCFLDYFIETYCKRMEKVKVQLDREAINYLTQYNWPGNVRELRNFAERLTVMAKKTVIYMSDIKDQFLHVEELSDGVEAKDIQRIENNGAGKSFNIAENEKISIKYALQNNKGSISNAAKELGISRTTLWRKIKKYNVNY